MRTKVELLQLLLDNIELIGEHGLCLAIKDMYWNHSINNEERRILERIIRNNPTESYLSDRIALYYFPAGEKEPRIKYLKQLIKHYENGQTIDTISFRQL